MAFLSFSFCCKWYYRARCASLRFLLSSNICSMFTSFSCFSLGLEFFLVSFVFRREDGPACNLCTAVLVLLGIVLLHPVQCERVQELRMELSSCHSGARHPGSLHHCIHRIRGRTLALHLSRWDTCAVELLMQTVDSGTNDLRAVKSRNWSKKGYEQCLPFCEWLFKPPLFG